MFLGPTGVGKTELAKALAAFLFKRQVGALWVLVGCAARVAVGRGLHAQMGQVGALRLPVPSLVNMSSALPLLWKQSSVALQW